MRKVSTAAGIAVALCAASATPSYAQHGASVSVPAPPPPAPTQTIPLYPYPPILPRIRPEIRCEQDRPIGDTSLCGEETAEAVVVGVDRDTTLVAVPKRLKRCEQDRPIGDTSPCEKR